jgi:hypothetical protein
MPSKMEKKLMTDAAVLEKIEVLTRTVEHLQERIEDLEDLRDWRLLLSKMAKTRLFRGNK